MYNTFTVAFITDRLRFICELELSKLVYNLYQFLYLHSQHLSQRAIYCLMSSLETYKLLVFNKDLGFLNREELAITFANSS